MNITLWFRKLYAAIVKLFSGGQSLTSPEKPPVSQEEPTADLDQSQRLSYFLDLSAALTSFSKFDLLGTGQAELYYATVEQEIGSEMLGQLLRIFHELELKAQDDHSILDQGLRSDILDSSELGNIARNIIKLWYSATWHSLTSTDKRIVSPQAYPEGLLWRSIGVNPPAAKAPGYASWSEEPEVTLS